ncbi:MAG: Mini-ribonuclease 3 [Erysipelotrichaceae bacterium]|nr:Mini-ribonuclease 3 [Erysipelotrichaceae bacterium]
MNARELSGSTLAYMGDAVWSIYARSYLLEKGYTKAFDLQKRSEKIVSAKAQAKFFFALEDFWTETEMEIFKRGRNFKSNSSPKNTDVQTYHVSTGFEALIGYLYLNKEEERLEQIWDKVRTLLEEES